MAVPPAAVCFYPSSSWVHAFAKMCDGSLAVWFKRGGHRYHGVRLGGVPNVCCWYPNAPPHYYDLAIVWPSAGKFVWRFLYRRLVYRLIAPPCAPALLGCGVSTACCPGHTIPTTLHLTVTDNGGCACLAGSQILTWNSARGGWESAISGCSSILDVFLSCSAAPNWTLSFGLTQNCGGIDVAATATATCSPFAITFSGITMTNTGCCVGTIDATVTA
jgi:hypothetical protein